MTTLAPVVTAVVTTTIDLQAQSDAENFEAATTVAQIFSGIVFMGLGVWMLISNGTKASYIQRASLEKRMMTCCAIDTYVALFSAFFNFFQLTEVDDIMIPRADTFVLDFSRPIEWIVTCPMMQVVLVLMGGSRIPEYRRVLMPALSLAVLCCGTTSMLLSGPVRFAFYATGFIIAMGMFTLNAKQVIEHSNGEENLWAGDSEFRKASLLLIVTWFPFPLWFFISPEGVGLINNILIIQMGWAFLNILSKFTFIFYIQRVKDNYCNRLKVRRELLGSGQNSANDDKMRELAGMMGIMPNNGNPFQANEGRNKEKELAAVVVETMTFLGMAQHNDRFLKLLREAKVKSVEQVEVLTQDQSDELKLPWDLVSALQKRIKVWRLEMTDNAELELEKGEAHYQAATPTAAVLPGEVGADDDDVRSQIARAFMNGPGGERRNSVSEEATRQMQEQMAQMQEMMNMLHAQAEQLAAQQMHRQSELEQNMKWSLEQIMANSNRQQGGDERMEQLMSQQRDFTEQAIDNLGRNFQAKMDSMYASQQRQAAENEANLLTKVNQIVQKQSEASADSLANTLNAKLDMSQAASLRQQSDLSDNMMRNLENAVAKMAMAGKVGEEGAEQLRGMTSRMEDLNQRQLRQLEDNVRRQITDSFEQAMGRTEKMVNAIRTGVQGDVNTLANGNNLVAETVRTCSDTQMEGMADLRRLSMMVLEQSSAALEKSNGGTSKLEVLQATVDAGVGRVLERLDTDGNPTNGGWSPGRPNSAKSPNQWPTQGSTSTSPMGSRRPSASASMLGADASLRPSLSSKYGMQVING